MAQAQAAKCIQNPNAAYFSERARAWDDEHQMDEARLNATRAVAWMAGVREGARVLDVGCGTGVMMAAYEALGASCVLGMDVAPGMIDIACKKFAGHDAISFRCADILQLETDERFDVAVVFNAYPHFLNVAALARKVATLVVPGGRFLVAHGMSRAAINAHHANVPQEVCRTLEPACQEAEPWKPYFNIDCMADTEHFYCFGGATHNA